MNTIENKIKDELIKLIQKGCYTPALPAVLWGLLDACEPRPEEIHGSWPILEALYEHIFYRTAPLAQAAWEKDPNAAIKFTESRATLIMPKISPGLVISSSYPHLHRASKPFVEAFDVVVQRHISDERDRSLKAWASFFENLLTRLCGLQTDQPIKTYLDNLATALATPESGTTDALQQYVIAIFSALAEFAYTARNNTRRADPLFTDGGLRALQDGLNSIDQPDALAIDKQEIIEIFNTIQRCTVQKFQNHQCNELWTTVLKTKTVPIPEQLVIEQILKCVHLLHR